MNNLIKAVNYFDKNFDQNKFVFFPKQITWDLSLNGTNVIQGNNPQVEYVPTPEIVNLIHPVINAGLIYSAGLPSISIFVQPQFIDMPFVATQLNSNVVFQTYTAIINFEATTLPTLNVMNAAFFTLQIGV